MIKNFSEEYKQNLIVISKANNFTDWMYSEIEPYLTGNVLEIGSGMGTYSEKIINDFKDNRVILSDINPESVQRLRNRFQHHNHVSVIELDLNNTSDFMKINQKIDSVLALNVLEHIQNDILVLQNIYSLLRRKGRFIVLVPAHKFLYNCIDEAAGHYRRYTKKEIEQKISKTKFKIKKIFYFNFLSIVGWYLNGSIFKQNIVNENAIVFFDKVIPFIRFVDKNILRKKMGISLIVVLEK